MGKNSILDVTENYRIRRLDQYNISVEKIIEVTKKNTGEKSNEWKIIGYHSELENALEQVYKRLVEDKLSLKEINNLQESITKFKETIEEVKNLFVEVNNERKEREIVAKS